MTIEEAIDYLTPIMEGRDYHQEAKDAAALNMAIAALRAQQTPAKLDRSRWKGCQWCNKYGFNAAAFDGQRYCDQCGKPLTKDAWAELEMKTFGGAG